MPSKQPAELLTIANHILGTGQLSLAKFLFITADDSMQLDTHNVPAYFQYVFERLVTQRDIHFYTNTSMDTLDYSGTGLNTGSKVVLAAYGEPVRRLSIEVPSNLYNLEGFENPILVMPGVVAIQSSAYENAQQSKIEMEALSSMLQGLGYPIQSGMPLAESTVLIIVCDDAAFTARTLNNFLWVSFTRCNPSHDIYGVDAFTQNKHWGCNGPIIFDARIKPHHAPAVEKDPAVEKSIEKYFNKGGSLYGKLA
jgi:4-hydroxy-3-polyprenylbenzoate decarboxylase